MAKHSLENPLFGETISAERLKRKLELVCGGCGAAGKYRLGVLILHPDLIDAIFGRRRWFRFWRVPVENYDKQVSCTGYFVCSKCGAGGPWRFPPATCDTLRRLVVEGALDVMMRPDRAKMPFEVGLPKLYDGWLSRTAYDGERHLMNKIEANPNSAFLWNRLANIYEKADMPDKTIAAFQKAIDLEPKDAESLYGLGIEFQKKYDRDRAAHHFHRMLEIAHDAVFHTPRDKRLFVHSALSWLDEWNRATKGRIPVFPPSLKANEAEVRTFLPDLAELTDYFLTSPADRARMFPAK